MSGKTWPESYTRFLDTKTAREIADLVQAETGRIMDPKDISAYRRRHGIAAPGKKAKPTLDVERLRKLRAEGMTTRLLGRWV